MINTIIMITPSLLGHPANSIVSQFGELTTIDVGEGGALSTILEFGAAIFSLLLFAVALCAWVRRGRQPTLLIVSFAFLTFFVRQSLEILPFDVLHTELASSILDFVTLGLFFIALVVAPRRKSSSRIGNEFEDAEPDHIKS